MKKTAFTLAEVLITLAIIGIVASITIPSIIANNQKKQLETALAKAYKTVTHMTNMAIAQHGDISTWDWEDFKNTSSEFMVPFTEKYFLPNLNVMKFCPTSQDLGCFPDITYKGLNGDNWANVNRRNTPKVLLTDGTSIAFNYFTNCYTSNARCMAIQIDTNGAKKPNVVGYDIHEWSFYPQSGEMQPSGIYKNNSYNNESNSWQR